MSRGYAIDSYQLDGVPTLDITAQDVSQRFADLVVYDGVEVLRVQLDTGGRLNAEGTLGPSSKLPALV